RILSPLCLPISPSGRRAQQRPSHAKRAPSTGLAGLFATKWWRREPESKRLDRICNPGHNRFAIAPLRHPGHLKKREAAASLFQNWSGKAVSNSRPQPWQGCALPTELFPQGSYTRKKKTGAGKESRTPDLNLGKVALYQLSYS